MLILRDILGSLESYDDDLTIYAERAPQWSALSRAIIAYEPEDAGLPDEAVGMIYFLEVHLAKEVIDVWSRWRDNRSPSIDEKCEAVIYYARNDAYLPA